MGLWLAMLIMNGLWLAMLIMNGLWLEMLIMNGLWLAIKIGVAACDANYEWGRGFRHDDNA